MDLDRTMWDHHDISSLRPPFKKLGPEVEVLRIFGIDKLFHYITAEDTPRKDLMLEKLLKTLEKQGVDIPPDRIIYIDDRDIHIGEIRRRVGGIHFLMYGRDIKSFEEAVEKISSILGIG